MLASKSQQCSSNESQQCSSNESQQCSSNKIHLRQFLYVSIIFINVILSHYFITLALLTAKSKLSSKASSAAAMWSKHYFESRPRSRPFRRWRWPLRRWSWWRFRRGNHDWGRRLAGQFLIAYHYYYLYILFTYSHQSRCTYTNRLCFVVGSGMFGIDLLRKMREWNQTHRRVPEKQFGMGAVRWRELKVRKMLQRNVSQKVAKLYC